MSVLGSVNIEEIIRQELERELTSNKEKPLRQLYEDVAYKYTLLRPAYKVEEWFKKWAEANKKVS